MFLKKLFKNNKLEDLIDTVKNELKNHIYLFKWTNTNLDGVFGLKSKLQESLIEDIILKVIPRGHGDLYNLFEENIHLWEKCPQTLVSKIDENHITKSIVKKDLSNVPLYVIAQDVLVNYIKYTVINDLVSEAYGQNVRSK